MATTTTTIQLLASAYSTNNATVTNASNAYTDVSSSTSATMVVSSPGNGQVYFSGFDFSQIPVSATINSVRYKIRAKTTSANTYVYVCLGNKSTGTELSAEQQLTTSETTYTCTPTSATWSDIVALGSNFAFRVNSRYASGRTVYVYGMEIDVTYTVQTVPNKVIYNGNTLIDLTGDTATKADVALGKLFHLANGEQATGTAGAGLQVAFVTSSSSTTSQITFTGLQGEPTAFMIMPYSIIQYVSSAIISTNTIVYDGTTTIGTTYTGGTSASSAGIRVVSTSGYFTFTYSNRTLTVSTSSRSAYSYRLMYVY